MLEHVLVSEKEIITDAGRRRRWTAAWKLRIVEETRDEGASWRQMATRMSCAIAPVAATSARWKLMARAGEQCLARS